MPVTIGSKIAIKFPARVQFDSGTRRGNMIRIKSKKYRLGNERGVTLIEIIVVIGLIGILAGVGTTMLLRELPNIRLKEVTRELFNDIQSARMHAIRRGLTCEVRPDANGYILVLMRNGADINPPLKSVDLTNYGGVAWGSLNAETPTFFNPATEKYDYNRLTIQPSGATNARENAGNLPGFYLRGGRDNQEGRKIEVSLLGRPRIRTWDNSSSTYK